MKAVRENSEQPIQIMMLNILVSPEKRGASVETVNIVTVEATTERVGAIRIPTTTSKKKTRKRLQFQKSMKNTIMRGGKLQEDDEEEKMRGKEERIMNDLRSLSREHKKYQGRIPERQSQFPSCTAFHSRWIQQRSEKDGQTVQRERIRR